MAFVVWLQQDYDHTIIILDRTAVTQSRYVTGILPHDETVRVWRGVVAFYVHT